MTTQPLTGKLVRLTVEDPETAAGLFATWNVDSEYQRLLDISESKLFRPKMMQAWIEKDCETIYLFIIRTLGDDRPVGFIELGGIDWCARSAWVGICNGPREDWSKGYGTDAMKVLLRFAFEELNLHRVNLSVFEYNPRAIRCYEKAGFQHEGRQREALHRAGKRWDMIYMGILQSDWKSTS
jgi:RimJ/RimL family protein N-acetyltransferase